MKNLPTYTPPESVWKGIEQQLNEAPLHEALRELPMYEPPQRLWYDIDARLDQHQNRWWWYAAAGLILPFVGIGLYLLLFYHPQEAVRYSVEHKTLQISKPNNSSTEQQYAQIEAYCQRQMAQCDTPDFRALKRELDELTTAQKQLKEVIGQYNTDENLMAQLTEIEQERSKILQKLVRSI